MEGNVCDAQGRDNKRNSDLGSCPNNQDMENNVYNDYCCKNQSYISKGRCRAKRYIFIEILHFREK